ncbi:F-box/LRR-repeat protein 15 isoform X2 [Neltuma alba]|uniref:F-box/LRR-repeat protein 15-like isoform X2 n=1 Tax=Neltuma alba TaxID=207710 RepID=UPI0010A5065B|nr:F-box/LRR-repeat protein 15-like isoform X2 [Prosopis alba]XP_028777363.1 F-box/LRR-repeat protein 15 isoform X2 [Prosopis alba]
MKFWCNLSFNEGEDEVMRGGDNRLNSKEEERVFGNDGLSDDDVGNDEQPLVGSDAPLAVEFIERETDDQFRVFEEMVRAVRVGGFASWTNTALYEGESSSAAAVVAAGLQNGTEDSRDYHHKRAKFHSDFDKCRFATSTSSDTGKSNTSMDYGDFENIPGSCLRYNNDSCYDAFALMNNTEDLEVKMDLTDDLLHMVFSFLDHPNLCKAARVCKQWRAASAHEDFWKFLNFEDRNISAQQFEDMCSRYPNATALSISGPAMHMLVMKAISSLRNLEVLTLGKGQILDNFFHALADCTMLKKLNINDATLGNGIQEISIYHDRLCHLQLTKCRVMRISVRCPLLETMSLKRSSMAQAVVNCPLLHELDIGSCHKLPDAVIRSAATSCPQLVSLDMSNCSCVSDETLREIAQNCANLSILDASYCPNISLESVRLPMLTVLKIHSCEGITSASMAAIAHSYMLEVLELDNCSLLTSVSLNLPRLQNIRLVHCRKFADLDLRTMMLSSIQVSNCPVLHRINITSNSLRKLALQKQDSLITLALQCQSLQEVDLSECESLTDSICKVFSDGGGCPMLNSLVLDNCESLTSVRFASTSLVNLSLVGCRAISTLELSCPKLEKVNLDGCDHLERASFSPVGLRSLNLGICPKLNTLDIEAPNMISLELKGCGVLSEASINCPLLISLDASFCSQLTDDCLSATTASCPLIESLILMSCPSVGSDGLCSLRWLPNLTVLDLSYTFLTNLEPVFESCAQLKVLKLQACKYLTDSSLEPLYKGGALPALQELDLSYGTLCQSAIEELLACCTHLTHVSLNGCANMHDLNWGYSRGQITELPAVNMSSMISHEDVLEQSEQSSRLLQNLNCVGCPNIRKVLIPPLAHCYHLLYLNLSLSVNLKEVDIVCLNLCFLNLSNCSSLETLKLECPRLSSLFLQSCNIDEEAVEAAISKCSMLETLDVRFCPRISSMNMGRLRASCSSLRRIFSSLSTS